MTALRKPARILIITPSATGADGISTLTCEVTRAVHTNQHGLVSQTLVWSLAGNTEGWAQCGWQDIDYRSAQGNKVRLAAWGVEAAGRYGAETLVIVMHLHLLPVVVPLMLRGARIVVFLNGIEAWRPLSRLETWMLRRAWRRIAISSYTATRFITINPMFSAHEIQICHLGLGEAPGMPSAAITREVFALIVARMAAEERYKGHDLLLELWPRIRADLPQARLVIVGDGDDRPRLQTKATSLGLEQHVTFLGRVSEETLVELYQRCAVFVMPSPNEGFGLVFVEAMRASAACIGSIGAAAEVIDHGVTGFVVDPQQPAQVYNALRQLLCDATLRLRMGAASAARFASYFTATHFQQRLCVVLELAGDKVSQA
jgi:phosphatidyl-myo-inositol dimannoside synthase